MKASLFSESDVPWCAYYNEVAAKWDADGLIIASAAAQLPETEENGTLEVTLSCTSYHLSDFAVSTTEADVLLVPVDLVRLVCSRIASCLEKTITAGEKCGARLEHPAVTYCHLNRRFGSALHAALKSSGMPSTAPSVQRADKHIARSCRHKSHTPCKLGVTATLHLYKQPMTSSHSNELVNCSADGRL